MLHEIHIAETASYSADGQSMTGLGPVTFLFGTNGSGKTTISRLIANPAAAPKSRLVWSNDRALECLVYNRDFAEKNFGTGPMPGIFTLGQAEIETLDLIEETRKEVASLRTDIDKLSSALGAAEPQSGELGKQRALRVAFEADCWKIKGEHDLHFKGAFEGLRNSKEKFCDRVLSELKSNTAGVKSVDDLKKRALSVFAEGIERRAAVPLVNVNDLTDLERDAILAKKIVGKDDIDVAALIKRLGNSDWVGQGLSYINQGGDPCPFCQQAVDAERLAKLNDYFDETYINDLASIDRVRDAHRTYAEALIARLREIQGSGHTNIDADTFGQLVDRLADRIELNGRRLDRKRKEASAPVTLEGLAPLVEPITAAIASANADVATHNALVDNITSEKLALIGEIWRCLPPQSDQDFLRAALARSPKSRPLVAHHSEHAPPDRRTLLHDTRE